MTNEMPCNQWSGYSSLNQMSFTSYSGKFSTCLFNQINAIIIILNVRMSQIRKFPKLCPVLCQSCQWGHFAHRSKISIWNLLCSPMALQNSQHKLSKKWMVPYLLCQGIIDPSLLKAWQNTGCIPDRELSHNVQWRWECKVLSAEVRDDNAIWLKSHTTHSKLIANKWNLLFIKSEVYLWEISCILRVRSLEKMCFKMDIPVLCTKS